MNIQGLLIAAGQNLKRWLVATKRGHRPTAAQRAAAIAAVSRPNWRHSRLAKAWISSRRASGLTLSSVTRTRSCRCLCRTRPTRWKPTLCRHWYPQCETMGPNSSRRLSESKGHDQTSPRVPCHIPAVSGLANAARIRAPQAVAAGGCRRGPEFWRLGCPFSDRPNDKYVSGMSWRGLEVGAALHSSVAPEGTSTDQRGAARRSPFIGS